MYGKFVTRALFCREGAPLMVSGAFAVAFSMRTYYERMRINAYIPSASP